MDANQNDTVKILVTINNKDELLYENMSLLELLEHKNIKKRSAIWLNGKQLLHAEYPVTIVKDGDIIKVLTVVSGG